MQRICKNPIRLLDASVDLFDTICRGNHTIRPAIVDDVPRIVQFISEERPSWRVFPSFLKASIESFPGKTLLSEGQDKKISGLACVTQLDRDIIMGAFTLVKESDRQSGLGMKLYQQVLDGLGKGNFLIEGTNENLEKYTKAGYKESFCVTVWRGVLLKKHRFTAPNPRSITLENFQDEKLKDIILYDRDIHPTNREWYFKKCIFGDINTKAKIAYQKSDVVGYGLLIPQSDGGFSHSLFANDFNVAQLIFASFLADLPHGTELSITVPDRKPDSIELVKQIGLKPDGKFTRMHLTYPVKIPWAKMFFNTPGDFTFI